MGRSFRAVIVVVGASIVAAPAAARSLVVPASTSPPAITGTVVVGETLSASTGTWIGDMPLAYAYQWQLCPSAGACSPIPGATGSSYALSSADLGQSLVVTVTASNASGSASAASAPTGAVVAATAPTPTASPAVSGTATEGATLTASPGTWSATGTIAYAYQWQRCTPAACTPIPYATSSSYAVAAADVGLQLRVVVAASTAGGTGAPAASSLSNVVGGPPSELAPPSVAGTPAVGRTLVVDPGRWQAPGSVAIAYQWQRCAPAGACLPIPKATAAAYTVGAGDAGSALKVTVAVSSAYGLATVTTAAATTVAAAQSALYHSLAAGVDISFPNCGRSRPRSLGFAIVGLNGGRPFTRNPCFLRESAWNAGTSAPRAVYLNTAFGPELARGASPSCRSFAAQVDAGASLANAYAAGCREATSAVAMLPPAFRPGVLWLDVEPSNEWSRNRVLNAASIEAMVATLHRLEPAAVIGIYSLPRWWSSIAGSLRIPAAPEWLPGPAAVCRQSFAGGAAWLRQGGGARLDVDYSC